MRRSGRKPYVIVDLETRSLDAMNEQSIYFRHMSKQERRAAAKHGWRNWYINRGRLPLGGDRRLERQLSWRRVH